MKFDKLSILIPAYNEEATIQQILDKVDEVDLPNGITKEIVIVNDCSSDKHRCSSGNEYSVFLTTKKYGERCCN